MNATPDGGAFELRVTPAAAVGDAAREHRLEVRQGPEVLAHLTLRERIGLRTPRWWYHVGCAVHAAPELGLFHRQRTLLLGNDLTGAAELIAIEAAAGAQGRAALDALLRQALAFAAGDPERFGSRLIAELPGRTDAQGRSPFWLGLGRHFHPGDDRAEAARFGVEAWRGHVAALLPRQPVYASFLAEEAQAAIGACADAARPLLAALEAAGLRLTDHVRIDDGGPVLACPLPPASPT
jgi:arginine N-succinyltransferase